MDIKKIYTADYSQEGYRDGVDAAKAGQPKSHFGLLRRHPLNFLWKSDSVGKSYASAYDRGYADGQRVAANIYHEQPAAASSSSPGETAMSIQQYRQAIQALNQGKHALQDKIRMLDSALDTYRHQVESARGVGLLEDYTQPLERHYRALAQIQAQMVADLQRMIAEVDNLVAKLAFLEHNSQDRP